MDSIDALKKLSRSRCRDRRLNKPVNTIKIAVQFDYRVSIKAAGGMNALWVFSMKCNTKPEL